MKRGEIVRALELAYTTESLVWVRRAFDGRPWRGFVVGVSETLVVFHVLSSGTMRLNGYTAIRLKDIQECTEDDTFAPTALKLMGERPRPQPDLLFVDIPGLLSSVGAHFPLLEVYQEKTNPSFYIGRVVGFGKKKVHLQAVSRGGEWGDIHKFSCADITRIDFGDGYDQALWLVARRQPRNLPRQK
ncbi:hypothetical protein [Armatimonas rosea]|uniref:Uncharacterized protein n=1 Tax=Armatimonas rosea TaxID=685828 RepID=A0A7W9SKN9_ARMRO|nr:hypothetical protein [Armatimonas rosea]MBB6048397.1 hypothetical protein [Armatimonas rosea]